MIIHNPILTGSFTVNGTDVASITSSAASITAINAYTASQNILNGTYATTGSNTFKNPQTINSNLIVTGSITAATLVVQTITSSVVYSSGSNVFGNLSSNTQVFTGSMYVTGAFYVTTGSVGLGTITPRTRFQVAGLTGQSVPGATGIATLGLANSSSVALFTNLDPDYGTLFGTLNTGVGWIQQQRVDGTGTAYNLLLQPNGGNVGIGTSTPQRTLSIANGGPTVEIDPNGGAAGPIYFNYNRSTSTYLTPEYWALAHKFMVSGGTEAMRITSGGLVGIGTSSPNASYKLTLSGASSGVVAGLALVDTEAYSYSIYTGASTLIFRDITNAAERMRISSAGDVYIGSSTTDKSSRLVVYGSTTDSSQFALRTFSNGSDVLFGVRNDGLLVTGTLSLSPYNYSVTGRAVYVNSGGVVGYNSSTRESKSNINSINDISWINALNPVTFNKRKKDNEGNYIDEVYEELDYGFIADEVEQVNDNFVFYDIKDGQKVLAGVEYGKLTAVLVKAIQELKTQNDALQAQITELKNK